MSFRQACLAVLIALTMLGPSSSSLMSRPAVAAAQDDETPTVDELLKELGTLRETLAKTRKDRDKYKARLEKANDKIADLEATIAALEADQPEPTPKPTREPTPKPTKEPDRGATSEERAYWRTAKGITVELIIYAAVVTEITGDPDFTSDVSLWYDLNDAMQPFHQLWTDWQNVSYPTARLETYHTAMTDSLYNYDQAATAFEIGLSTFDADYIQATVDYLLEADEALGRAADAVNAWEKETGTQVDDL